MLVAKLSMKSLNKSKYPDKLTWGVTSSWLGPPPEQKREWIVATPDDLPFNQSNKALSILRIGNITKKTKALYKLLKKLKSQTRECQ